jgi:predicted dienelactone hydrolase
MHTSPHALINEASKIPIGRPSPVISYSPVVLPCKDRRVDLELRVTVPATGDGPLPIILLSHGAGPSNYLASLDGFTPVAEFWAAHGFAVLQPTHLNSRFLNIELNEGNFREIFLDSRATDMSRILDRLDEVEAAVPALLGARRLDPARVAAVGHSLGGITVSMLLGAENMDPRDGVVSKVADPRVRAGIVLGGTGVGGPDNLTEAGLELVPFYDLDFTTMRAPALICWGDEDVDAVLTKRGADWHLDPYTLAPGPKDALMVKGGHHAFGGVSGWDAAETKDESPERLAAVQRLTWAYLRSQLYEEDPAWQEACKALEALPQIGKVETKA